MTQGRKSVDIVAHSLHLILLTATIILQGVLMFLRLKWAAGALTKRKSMHKSFTFRTPRPRERGKDINKEGLTPLLDTRWVNLLEKERGNWF